MNGEVEVKRKNNRGISTCRRRRIKSEGKAKEKSERKKGMQRICEAEMRKDQERICIGLIMNGRRG